MDGILITMKKLLLSLCLILFYAATSLAWAEQPSSLPLLSDSQKQAWRVGGDRFFFLDFYSSFCGTCEKIEPYLDMIKKDFAPLMQSQRVDLSDTPQRDTAKPFDVKGTPTYILFDQDGKPVYRMHNYISLGVLIVQLKRFTNQLPTETLPADNLAIQTAKNRKGYVLLAVHPKNCDACTELDPYLNAIDFAFDTTSTENRPALAVARVQPQSPGITELLKKLNLPDKQAYIFLDPDNHALLRHTGPINPQELWKNIKLLTDNGLAN